MPSVDIQRQLFILLWYIPHAPLHTYIHILSSYMYTYLLAYNICMHALTHAVNETLILICVHTFINACIHTYIHTYISAYKHILLELSISIIFGFLYFQNSRILILLKIWKSGDFGNMGVLELCQILHFSLAIAFYFLLCN